MKTLKYLALGFIMSFGLVACSDDYMDVEDTSALDADQAAEAAGKDPDAFLKGVWAWLINFSDHNAFGVTSVGIIYDVMGEDVAQAQRGSGWFGFDYQLDYRLEMWVRSNYIWSLYYTTIAKANEIIAIYPDGVETASQKALCGQAYALRGWAYDNLIQVYQDYMGDGYVINREAPGVPMYYTVSDNKSEEETKQAKSRNTVGAVLDQAGLDLDKAVELLAAAAEMGYERPSRNYVDVTVANGFLARHNLLIGEWQKAADAANAARQGYTQRDENSLFDGYMDINACDAMWGYEHNAESNTAYASFHSHMSNLSYGYAGLNSPAMLIDARLYSKIPADDLRKALFNGAEGWEGAPTEAAMQPYANLKFGAAGGVSFADMDYIYMRAAEMVLIEAEAYARLNDGSKAATVLAELMASRQPGWNKAIVSVDDVLLQRRIELWGEGFGLLDVKRNNTGIDRTYEGTNHMAGELSRCKYEAHDVRFTYQIPLREIQENDMINEEDQNP